MHSLPSSGDQRLQPRPDTRGTYSFSHFAIPPDASLYAASRQCSNVPTTVGQTSQQTATTPSNYRISGSADRDVFYQHPPSLNYTLRDKKFRIALFWCFVLFDCAILPSMLYFVLWYDAGPGSENDGPLSASEVLTIVTATIGGTTIIEYALRTWKLWKRGSDCRVLGSCSRWSFDWFHWWFGLCLLVVIAELVLGTAGRLPNRRLLAMPLASVQAIFAAVILVTDALHLSNRTTSVRISSIQVGVRAPPGIYPFIEDTCAVSGSGGTLFRASLQRRHTASPAFQTMLQQLSLFWGIGLLGCAVGTMYLVLSLDDIDVAYALGWALPFVWAGFWSVVTIASVRYMLVREARLWAGGTLDLRDQN